VSDCLHIQEEGRLFGSRGPTGRPRGQANADLRIAKFLTARGDAARDAQDWWHAALWYEEALRLSPQRGDLHVQHGHMLKETGRFPEAEQAYLRAQALMPDDADLSLQLGHLYKKAGRQKDARLAYERAILLKPNWGEAERELAALRPTRGEARASEGTSEEESSTPSNARELLAESAAALSDPARLARLIPSLAPRKPTDLLRSHDEGVRVLQMGRHEHGFWGLRRTVRGAQAVRGFCISYVPIDEVQLLIDGIVFRRESVLGPYKLRHESRIDSPQKYVFNLWQDFSRFDLGRHAFELRIMDVEGETRSFHDEIVIAPPLSSADFPDSDAVVEIGESGAGSLEYSIRAAPTVVRSAAARKVLPRAPENILVLRTDQLGDMVASVPALRRLRALFPAARLVGLVTAANAELAASLRLLDEVIVVEFPDDPIERRRLMNLSDQEKLRAKLEPYNFDLAIDLAQAGVSRDLLRLSGAPFLYGVEGDAFHWLSADFALNTRDPINRLDVAPHSRKVLALVETLGAIVKDNFEVVRRPELRRDRLKAYGIGAEDRFIVLHMGARVAFSRWPSFPELAALLMQQTDLKIVMMTEDPDVRSKLSPELLNSSRFQLLDQRLSFDDFDAFLSFATVMVGNDSGPKHLASLRGTNTVTLHTARINWSTWGHEGPGVIMSRRVPCAGCDIFHEPEDCGKDFACIRDIRPREVLDAVCRYL